jgi:hypothetical protein
MKYLRRAVLWYPASSKKIYVPFQNFSSFEMTLLILFVGINFDVNVNCLVQQIQ